jgi:hypothetical protein
MALRPNRLDEARRAASYGELIEILGAKLESSGDSLDLEPKTLGSLTSDLVYFPVVPCRLFDTRVAVGAFGDTEQRSYWTYPGGNLGPQGGNAAGCGIPGEVAAIAVNFTVVGSGGTGFGRAWAHGGAVPFASVMNYTPGAILPNTTVIPLNQTVGQQEFSVRIDGSPVHVIGDVVGYFWAPFATPLQTTGTELQTPFAAGATVTVQAPACPAGYVVTGGLRRRQLRG